MSDPARLEEFSDVVRELRACGWVSPPMRRWRVGFLAVRPWSDGSVDTIVVFDLDHVEAKREDPSGTTVWSFHGDLHSVRLALASLPSPTEQRSEQPDEREQRGVGRPLWAPGVIGDMAHLVETEDGDPRDLTLPEGPAWIAVCRRATHPRPASVAQLSDRRCGECADIDAELCGLLSRTTSTRRGG